MSGIPETSERYLRTRWVTVVGGIIDLLLGVLKIFVGFIAHSQALIADGVHSLSDLATDFLVIWAAKHASRKPDSQHPYGHQRIETAASMVLGMMLVGVAFGIAYDSVQRILDGTAILIPGAWALVVAGLSVVLKEAIYHYTMRAANDLDSELLRSNAWHSRSDALSSIVVIIGVAGTMAGLTYLDAVAAIVVALMIIAVGGKMIWTGVQELTDRGLDPERVANMMAVLQNVEGVVDVHDLRTRRMGADVYVDGHVLVDSKLSVSEGHRIGEAVRQQLREEFPKVADFIVHIDAEDDEAYQRSDRLPLRRDFVPRLRELWRDIPEARDLDKITLHYLNGKIHVEVWLPSGSVQPEQVAPVRNRLRNAAGDDPDLGTIEVLFNPD
ncbi:MAG: cation diffusion facilitator family transporter [Gammaproteobacteria bacterium]|nr:cation diffusion facilitator family transporter [Gammaproteobacteria bacterium]